MNFRAGIIQFPGSNGDRDLFETFKKAGFKANYIAHTCVESLEDFDVVGLPGGFAYGDYWRAGMLASQSPILKNLPQHIKKGGLVIGICNGFQILIEAGFLTGALTYNSPPGFRHTWVDVEICKSSLTSPWFFGLDAGRRLRLPRAHGEGCYINSDGAPFAKRYRALRYKANPNGSLEDTAALLDPTGQVLGIMPHPERATDKLLGSADGLTLFEAAQNYLSAQSKAVKKKEA